jgi:beta-mannosidase
MATLDLSGTWTLTRADGAPADPLPCTVPGDVHSALLAAGRLSDPYVGLNEHDAQWVGQAEWRMERSVELPAAVLAKRSVCLSLDHPDTFATVLVNGHEAGRTANRFRRYRFEVKPLLMPGRNTVTAVFASAEREAAARAARQPYPIPMIGNNRKPGHNLIRKTQCHAGWDWGVTLMVLGLPDAAQLIACDTARIEHVWTTQRHEAGKVHVDLSVELWSPAGGRARVALDLEGRLTTINADLAPGTSIHTATLTVDQPQLWWPNGLGAQRLYSLRVSTEGQVVEKRLGLRIIQVIHQPDQWGTSMTVRVNGLDVFCKGANWIPADGLPARQTPERFRDLLRSAAAANMNMLRVWGGGQFESDAFYAICDELGLMLWHDLMFACSLYPADKDFLSEVRAEVEHQVKRLRDHACIALWCGDNECVGALGWYPEAQKSRDRYVINWDRLNRACGEVIEATDPGRVFWPSSPCSGPGDFGDAWHDDSKGDMHYWDVWHAGKPIEAYYTVKPRFCSEFGFQSFSSTAVARTFATTEDDLNPTSPVMEHHQRHPAGNRIILETMTRYFRMPKDTGSTLWLSQVQQALAIGTAVQAWRIQTPRCMGTLYWQLNDNWPVASWSSLEYDGRWKQLHHHVRRLYAPLSTVLALPDGSQDRVELWVVSDRGEALSATATLEVWTFAGELLETITVTGDAEARTATRLADWDTTRFCPTAADRATRFLHVRVSVGGTVISAERVFAPWKAFDLARPALTTATTGDVVTVATDKPAFFVTVAATNRGEFDDNSFTLLPGRPRTVRFAAGTPGAVELMNLRASY